MPSQRNVPARNVVDFGSPLETQFYQQLRLYLPRHAVTVLWQVTYAHPRRRFLADFGWLGARVLVECQGGIFNRKAHGSVSGILRDIERLNWASACGYRMFRYSDKQAQEPTGFFALLREALEATWNG